MTTVRAAAHVHSDWSYDGSWALEQLIGAFDARGYGVVLTAEHDRGWDERRWDAYCEACASISTESVLVVPGIEYADPTDAVHIPVWGAPFLEPALPTSELLARARVCDAFSVWAHPGRRDAWRLFEPAWADSLDAVEVWNRKYDGWAPSPTALRLAGEWPSLAQTVGLDFHTQRQFFPLALQLDLAARTPDAVVATLRSRRFSCGVGRLDASRFSGGPAGRGASGAEWARRRAARALRALRSA
jgi:hypothetical protein